MTYKFRLSICSVLAAFSFFSFTICRLGCRKPTTVRWHGADSRAYRVTPKKLFEDMDKYIEATKDLKLIL